MQSRWKRAAVGMTTATLIAGVAGGATTLSASGAPQTKTVRFTAVETGSHNFPPTGFAGTDVERHNGKVIGYDTFDGTFDLTTHVAHLRVAVSWRGGMLFIRGRQTEAGVFTGTITGGNGKYQGATGTVTGHQHGPKKTRLVAHVTF
jgi:hypothetical protein